MLILAVLSAANVGCSPTDTAGVERAGAAVTAGAQGSKGIAYEVVTVERPESVEDFHKIYRASYDLCVDLRKILKMPPPAPMKQPPADFISKRTTYISDGKTYLTRGEYFTYQVVSEEPTFTCETVERKTSDSQLVRDGKVYDVSIDETGQRFVEEPEDWLIKREESEGGIYTEARTVGGFAVKCMPPMPVPEELQADLCIADLKPGTLTDVTGEPLVLSSRVRTVEKMVGAILTEPRTVKVGHKIDPAVFDAAAAP